MHERTTRWKSVKGNECCQFGYLPIYFTITIYLISILNNISYLINTMALSLLGKPPVARLLKTFYRIRRFITVFTRALHWSLSSARSIRPNSLRSILIFSFHIRLGLPSGLFSLAFPPKSYINSSSPHACYMSRPSHPPWSDLSYYTWRKTQLMKLIIQFSSASYYFILLRSKYSPQHPVLKTLGLCSSLNVRDQVSHPYKTMDKIIDPYIYIY
jgi:hypothetical protein